MFFWRYATSVLFCEDMIKDSCVLWEHDKWFLCFERTLRKDSWVLRGLAKRVKNILWGHSKSFVRACYESFVEACYESFVGTYLKSLVFCEDNIWEFCLFWGRNKNALCWSVSQFRWRSSWYFKILFQHLIIALMTYIFQFLFMNFT